MIATRHDGADRERGRHQDGLVDERAFRDGPDDRQLAFGTHARHLLRVEREVVAEHPRGLLGGDLGEDGDVVEDARDVVEQGE